MSATPQQTTLLTELNWQEVVSSLHQFPFRISSIQSIEKEIGLSRISFKYNLRGQEVYCHGSNEVKLSTGMYLVSTNLDVCDVSIKSRYEKDLGVCIDIHPGRLQQALQVFLQPNTSIQECHKVNFYLDDIFFRRHISNREFHAYMYSIYTRIKLHQIDSLEELEFEFVRQFLFHQLPDLLTFARIPAIKKSTKRELYLSMMEAKGRLHDSVYSSLSMEELARGLFLSEYRLFHLFKDAFGISPHKYLIQLKMNEAVTLARQQQLSWTEIAARLKFADIQSFSKLFKKYQGLNPSEYCRGFS